VQCTSGWFNTCTCRYDVRIPMFPEMATCFGERLSVELRNWHFLKKAMQYATAVKFHAITAWPAPCIPAWHAYRNPAVTSEPRPVFHLHPAATSLSRLQCRHL
jgi:hypothetical protein